jgi:hypothetical protein
MQDTLLPAIERLDQALEDHTAGPVEWLLCLNGALAQVGQALQFHAFEAEAPGGLFEMVDTSRPTLGQQVADLSQEHADFLARVNGLRLDLDRALTLARHGAPPPDHLPGANRNGSAWNVEVLRRQALELNADLNRHWGEEADLVIESIIRGIGGRFDHLSRTLAPHF